MDEELLDEQIKATRLAKMRRDYEQGTNPDNLIRQYEQAIIGTLGPSRPMLPDYEGARSQSKSQFVNDILLPGQRSTYFGGPYQTLGLIGGLQDELKRGMEHYTGLVKPVESLTDEDKINQTKYLDERYNQQLGKLAEEKDFRKAYKQTRELYRQYQDDVTNGYLAQHQANVDIHRKTLKDLQERFGKGNITQEQFDKSLMLNMKKYKAKGGVGEYVKDKLAGYGTYDPMSVVEFQDVDKHANDLTEGWKANKDETAGVWYKDGEWWMRSGTKGERKVTYKEVYDKAIQMLRNNKKIMEYVDQEAMLNAQLADDQDIDLQLQQYKALAQQQGSKFNIPEDPQQKRDLLQRILVEDKLAKASDFSAEKQSFIEREVGETIRVYDQAGADARKRIEENLSWMTAQSQEFEEKADPFAYFNKGQEAVRAANQQKSALDKLASTLKISLNGKNNLSDPFNGLFNASKTTITANDLITQISTPSGAEELDRRLKMAGYSDDDRASLFRSVQSYQQSKIQMDNFEMEKKKISDALSKTKLADKLKNYGFSIDDYMKYKSLSEEDKDAFIKSKNIASSRQTGLFANSRVSIKDDLKRLEEGHQSDIRNAMKSSDKLSYNPTYSKISALPNSEFGRAETHLNNLILSSGAQLIDMKDGKTNSLENIFGLTSRADIKDMKVNMTTEFSNNSPVVIVSGKVKDPNDPSKEIYKEERVTLANGYGRPEVLRSIKETYLSTLNAPKELRTMENASDHINRLGAMYATGHIINYSQSEINNAPINKQQVLQFSDGTSTTYTRERDLSGNIVYNFGGKRFNSPQDFYAMYGLNKLQKELR